MAPLLVCDTSVLIDLERGGVLHEIFILPFEVGVPDVLHEGELKHWHGPDLEAMGLRVLSLDGAGVSLAQSYRVRERRLSLPDAFALALAKVGSHVLLAGDGSLRALAATEHVQCHGVLWVLDELEQSRVLPADQLLHALLLITSHPRCRLPNAEVQVRLARYRRAKPLG
jgi:hypothetical protein